MSRAHMLLKRSAVRFSRPTRLARPIEPRQELGRPDDGNVVERMEDEEVVVARYDDIRLPVQCDLQDLVVLWIPAGLDARGRQDLFPSEHDECQKVLQVILLNPVLGPETVAAK